MRTSIYQVRGTWDEAVDTTDDGLSPLAVKLIPVTDLPDINAELALGDKHYPYVLVCMSTVFTNKSMDGKLGWSPIFGEAKQHVSKMLYEHGLLGTWVFLSQVYDEA